VTDHWCTGDGPGIDATGRAAASYCGGMAAGAGVVRGGAWGAGFAIDPG
jgi:hypothetical protein